MKVFVFGSNLAGRHGAGAAKHAVQEWGAIYGRGVGLQGNAFAIPTKDRDIKTLPIDKIRPYVNGFITFARENPSKTFLLTAIGCGYAGYTPEDIAPLFKKAVDVPNVYFPYEFLRLLGLYNKRMSFDSTGTLAERFI